MGFSNLLEDPQQKKRNPGADYEGCVWNVGQR